MIAPRLDNWICDIYIRIDAECRITDVKRRQYRDEIHWCYRLGYMSHDDYYVSLEYLDTQATLKEIEFDREHSVRLAQIQYEQGEIRKRDDAKEVIRQLFLTNVFYDKSKKIYKYKGDD